MAGSTQDGAPRNLWQSAEQAALVFMRDIGFTDAALTSPGADRGLDVIATGAAAQVKAYSDTPVGRPDVQRLRGASFNLPIVLFFSLSGYTQAAVEYADEVRIALFTLRLGLPPLAVNGFGHALSHRSSSGYGHHVNAAAERSGAPGRGRQQWSTGAKVVAVLAAPAAITVTGPLLFAVGREAMRRSAGSDPDDGSAGRRLVVTVAGVMGTVLLLSVVVQNAVWAVTGAAPADGSPGLGAGVGAAVGIAVVLALNAVVRASRLAWLPMPKVLCGPPSPKTRPPEPSPVNGD